KASQGDDLFVAPNPDFGATFTYYLKEDLKTREQTRAEREKDIAERGGDTPYPGWDALREEELEEDPAVVLTVRDADGDVVRHLTGPTAKGIHRVSWSLTYPSTDPWVQAREDEFFDMGNPEDGVLVEPGTYTVHLSTRVDGELTDSGKSQSFVVKPLHDGGTLPGASPSDAVAFRRQLAEMQRATGGAGRLLGDTSRRLEAIRQTLDRSTVDGSRLGDEVRAMSRRVADMQERLSGNVRRGMANDPGPVSISARLSVVSLGTDFSVHGPIATHRQSLAIAQERFEELKNELNRLIRTELPALERRLDAAGVPWTPGRAVPGG
ncbi:MAG: glycosyl hydrolase, partial [Planctomycetota bacterium]